MSIRLSTCTKCGKVSRAPQYSCGACNEFSTGFSESDSTGNGVIYSSTTIFVAGDTFEKDAPYNMALVTLDEGLNVLGRLPKESILEIGTKVKYAETKDGIDYFSMI